MLVRRNEPQGLGRQYATDLLISGGLPSARALAGIALRYSGCENCGLGRLGARLCRQELQNGFLRRGLLVSKEDVARAG